MKKFVVDGVGLRRSIHRSSVVNLDFVKEIQPMFRGEYHVIMRDGIELKLSHGYRESVSKIYRKSLAQKL